MQGRFHSQSGALVGRRRLAGLVGLGDHVAAHAWVEGGCIVEEGR